MKLTDNIMFVRLAFAMPRQTRKVKAESDVAPDRLRASAKLYSGKGFATIKSHDAETRNGLMRLAINIPSCFRGTCILPSGMIDPVTAYLDERAKEREALVESFIVNDYAKEIVAAREALGGSFRESDFPAVGELRGAFRSEWSVFSLEVPDGLPDDVKQAETEKLKSRMSSVYEECRLALRETLAGLVEHLADRLAPGADGSRKKLHATTVEQLREFLTTVEMRDITSDEELHRLSAKAREIVGATSAETLRNDNDMSARMRSGLTAIKTEIDGLIERDGGRNIDLDME